MTPINKAAAVMALALCAASLAAHGLCLAESVPPRTAAWLVLAIACLAALNMVPLAAQRGKGLLGPRGPSFARAVRSSPAWARHGLAGLGLYVVGFSIYSFGGPGGPMSSDTLTLRRLAGAAVLAGLFCLWELALSLAEPEGDGEEAVGGNGGDGGTGGDADTFERDP